MSATEYTARDFLVGLVHPAMEARALGMQQTKVVWNPSPECDSIIEYLARVQDRIPPDVFGELLRLLRELLESNAAEGEQERRLARFADQMAKSKRQQECNGTRES